MQTQNPFLDEVSKLATAAIGIAQAAGDEAKAALRSQAERLAADFDLVRRDEFEALKAELDTLRREVETLRATGAPKRKAPGGKAARATQEGG